MARPTATLFALVVVVALVAAACGGGESADVTKVRDPAEVASGQELYGGNCGLCHSAGQSFFNLEGSQSPEGVAAPALIDKLRQSDADLVNIALEGKGTDMPAFAGVLSEAEIQQIVDYIRSTQAANQ